MEARRDLLGGVIEGKSHVMRQGAHLPEDLWCEIYSTAIYLHNRLVRYIFDWKSPYDRFYTYLAHRDCQYGLVRRVERCRQAEATKSRVADRLMSDCVDLLKKDKKTQKSIQASEDSKITHTI